MEIMFSVPGEPTGKGRPRMTKQGHTYTPQKTVEYENLVRQEYLRQCGVKFQDNTPLLVKMKAIYAIPKTASKDKRRKMEEVKLFPLKRPDIDNVCKCILDALNGIAYRDDAQVVDCRIVKIYGNTPRVEIEIAELE